jgi:hypothetical protein
MLRRFLNRARRMRITLRKPFGRDVMPELLRVSLCNRSPDVVQALVDRFRDADGVEVLEGDLLDLDRDALVSPANGFGDMGGGIDQAIDRFYGGEAQRAVMGRIAERFYGELPVGAATIPRSSVWPPTDSTFWWSRPRCGFPAMCAARSTPTSRCGPR